MQAASFWNAGYTKPERQPPSLPDRTDVAVVGAGYTGLCVALHLARGGRSVIVLDAEDPGFGCSSRNGGMVGPSFHKLGMDGLTKKYGEARARDILHEGMRALDFFDGFVREEDIECRLDWTGRFRGAFSAKDYDALCRSAERLQKAVGLRFHEVPRERQHAEIGTDFYRGGIVYEQDGGIQPRLLAQELLRQQAAGARVVPYCRVLDRVSEGDGHRLKTQHGEIRAREVVVATNGYTDNAFKAFRRRLIPVRSTVIATEPLGEDVVHRLSPKLRMHGDTRRMVLWYRPSPDGTRMIFGGRAFTARTDAGSVARDLHGQAAEVFPELAKVKVGHVWWGDVAYTFDHAPHLGRLDGVHYAIGYCGSGITRSVYLGRQLARRMLCQSDSRTAFDDLPFETRPFYRGKPHGLGLVMRWHRHQDRKARVVNE